MKPPPPAENAPAERCSENLAVVCSHCNRKFFDVEDIVRHVICIAAYGEIATKKDERKISFGMRFSPRPINNLLRRFARPRNIEEEDQNNDRQQQ